MTWLINNATEIWFGLSIVAVIIFLRGMWQINNSEYPDIEDLDL